MKNLIKTIILMCSITVIGALMLTSFSNPEQDIIGSWILETDTNSKWVFTENTCYWYYNGNLEDNFIYTIQDLSNTSPDSSIAVCGHEVKTGGTEDFYLKLVDLDNEEYCYEILNLNDESLSINYLGQSKIMVFEKE